jgi:hypothetical protein
MTVKTLVHVCNKELWNAVTRTVQKIRLPIGISPSHAMYVASGVRSGIELNFALFSYIAMLPKWGGPDERQPGCS